jgi:hypothetical protein
MNKLMIVTLALFLTSACTKEQKNSNTEMTSVAEDPNQVSLEQTPIDLKSADGKMIKVTYFAKGNDVAVKLKQENQPEEILIAKKISATGDPIFTNTKFMWEGAIAKGGKLTDVDGKMIQFSELEKTK